MASTVTQDVQEQILSTIRKSQEIALDALKSWVETVQAITPNLPSVSVPFADRLPDAHELVASSYKFAEQILTSQKKFADEVLEATSPLLPGEGDGSSKSASAK
jgi:ABC-type transporter Mla subunit MlaD